MSRNHQSHATVGLAFAGNAKAIRREAVDLMLKPEIQLRWAFILPSTSSSGSCISTRCSAGCSGGKVSDGSSKKLEHAKQTFGLSFQLPRSASVIGSPQQIQIRLFIPQATLQPAPQAFSVLKYVCGIYGLRWRFLQEISRRPKKAASPRLLIRFSNGGGSGMGYSPYDLIPSAAIGPTFCPAIAPLLGFGIGDNLFDSIVQQSALFFTRFAL